MLGFVDVLCAVILASVDEIIAWSPIGCTYTSDDGMIMTHSQHCVTVQTNTKARSTWP
jgi:hypothetical protein